MDIWHRLQQSAVDSATDGKRKAPEYAGIENAIWAKLHGWKMHEWKMREQTEAVENAGVEKAGVDSMGGKCRSKSYGTPTREYIEKISSYFVGLVLTE